MGTMSFCGVILLAFGLIGCAPLTVCPFNAAQIDKATQVLYVKAKPQKTPMAILEFWQKQEGRWVLRQRMQAVVGRMGVAPMGLKKEGDGKTPSGVFSITQSFGYTPNLKTGLDYQMVTSDDLWVDDSESPDYNQWVKAPTQAKSYEHLRREDVLYSTAMVIDYNRNPIIKGAGSAIFLHIWRNYHHPTSGCVAVSQRHMRHLIQQLRKDENPTIIIENPS